jgi:hypothetical protein
MHHNFFHTYLLINYDAFLISAQSFGQPFNVWKIEFIVNTKFAFFIGRNFFKVDRTLIQGRCIRLQLMPSAKVWTCICAWSFAHNEAYFVFVFKSLLTTPRNVLPLHLNQTFLPIIWIFTEGVGDGIKSRLTS